MSFFIKDNFAYRWSFAKTCLFVVVIYSFIYALGYLFIYIDTESPQATKGLESLYRIGLFYFYNRILLTKGVKPLLSVLYSIAWAFLPILAIYFLWKVGEQKTK